MKINFLKNYNDFDFSQLVGKSIYVYKKEKKIDYPIENIEFEKFKYTYLNYEVDNIIIQELNEIFVPARRCEGVFEYLQTMSPKINKYIINTKPFIGEPWRVWFNYSVALGSWLNINYSYAIETDWQHKFYKDTDLCLLDSIKDNIIETETNLEKLYTKYEQYELNSKDLEYYKELKEHLFERYNTPKLIIINLLKELNKYYGLDISFESYLSNKNIKYPNIGIYNFVIEENKYRQQIYNLFCKNETY